MRSVRLFICCSSLLVVMLLIAPAGASAVTCGEPASESTKTPTSGQLTLDTEHSAQSLDFGDQTDPDSFRLYLKVAGCTITDSNAVQATARASGSAQGALGEPVISAKGSLLVVTIGVTPDKFPAKQIKPVLTVSGSTIDSTLVSLSMQRKEPPFIPIIVAVLAALLGGVWALWLAFGAAKDKARAGETVTFDKRHALTALVGGAIAAYAVFKTTYLDPLTWESSLIHLGTLAIGVASAAAGGATAGAATAFKISKERRKRKAAKTAKETEERQ